MRLIHCICSVLICQFTIAQAPDDLLTAKEHLISVNSLWENYDIPDDGELISFSSIDERISYHFQHVLELILLPHSLEVEDDQQRDELISALENYSEERVFPINTLYIDRPYFIDDFGNACAVGHLMIKSGNEELALRIQQEHNLDFIRDITTEGIVDWAAQNGLTIEELALIQPAGYSPPDPALTAISNGLNGTVSSIIADEELNRLYFSGAFNFISEGDYCTGLAYYEGSQVHCMEPPSHIRINALNINEEHQLIATGLFNMGEEYFPMIIGNENDWEVIAIPGRPGAEGIEVLFTSGPNPEMIAVIQPEGQDEVQEIWFQESTEEWSHMATINGKVHCTNSNGYEFLGGDFDSYIDHLQDDLIQPSSGLMYTHFYPIGEYFMGSVVADSLPEVIHKIDGNLSQMYIAGTGDDIFPNDYLSVYSNGESSPLITYTGAPWIDGVRDFHFLNEDEMLIATDTYVDMGGFTFGFGLGIYNVNTGYVIPKAYLDSVPSNIEEMNGRLFIGGPFTQNNNQPIPYLAEMDAVTSIPESSIFEPQVYPNPSSSIISISNLHDIQEVSISNVQGKEVLRSENYDGEIDLGQLTPGSYYIQVSTRDGIFNVKLIKE